MEQTVAPRRRAASPSHAAKVDIIPPGLEHPITEVVSARVLEIMDAIEFAIGGLKNAGPNAQNHYHQAKNRLKEAIFHANSACCYEDERKKELKNNGHR